MSMQKKNQPNQTVFYRHFKNLRRKYKETKQLNTSCLHRNSQPDWDSQTIRNQKKKIADLCDVETVCKAIGSISATTLPLIKNFGPALNRFPKTAQRLQQYEISDTKTPYGFEKGNQFRSGKFCSTLYFTGQIQPNSTSACMEDNTKEPPTTIMIDEEESAQSRRK